MVQASNIGRPFGRASIVGIQGYSSLLKTKGLSPSLTELFTHSNGFSTIGRQVLPFSFLPPSPVLSLFPGLPQLVRPTDPSSPFLPPFSLIPESQTRQIGHTPLPPHPLFAYSVKLFALGQPEIGI